VATAESKDPYEYEAFETMQGIRIS